MKLCSKTSPKTDKKSSRFSQATPFQKCHCGIAKCRDPRCSFQGFKGWALKQAGMASYFLKFLRPKSKVYRGCLKLPFNATIEDHKNVRAKFLASVKRGERANACFIKIRAYQHTECDGCHYEYLIYSNCPNVDDVIRRLWKQSGGIRPFCVEVSEDRIDRWARYNTKATKRHNPRYLAERNNGLDMVWGNSRFFTIPEKDLWERCVDEWYSDPYHRIQDKIAQDTIPLTPEQRDTLFLKSNSDIAEVCYMEARYDYQDIQKRPWVYKEQDKGLTIAQIKTKLVRGWRHDYEQFARYAIKFPTLAKQVEDKVKEKYQSSKGKRYCNIRRQVWWEHFDTR